ncbi:MAG: class I SAM-dependent DNA methyltransferase [Bordetella sp.]|nr:class I SAM-dependent DNA methyltransferase [Bordetella sp.]
MDAEEFIARWSGATLTERSNCQTFIIQLCAVLGVAAPDQGTAGDPDYCFERTVKFPVRDGRDRCGSIDCFKRDSFVMEIKQSRKRAPGGELDPRQLMALLNRRGRPGASREEGAVERLMVGARHQAESYAQALAERPPFLVLVDVGKAVSLWADFQRGGKGYAPFPDLERCRIPLSDLRDPAIRERLRKVWDEPESLNPAKPIAEATSEIAAVLGELIRLIRRRLLEDGRSALQPISDRRISIFVLQCVFAMFADSVGLIRGRGFLNLLKSYRGKADRFHISATDVLRHMRRGGHCAALRQDLPRFDGGLFREEAALALTEDELEVLIVAASHDWRSVEPATFGTLLEQALDPDDRRQLGAHYTPKAYVQRLVEATIMEPLRADLEAVRGSAVYDFALGRAEKARKAVRGFHRTLCSTRVLDPACGTGNFLYVAMAMMKDLESDVLNLMRDLGDDVAATISRRSVGPSQFWGIEKCAHAASIAEMVMWIGYLQWRLRNGDAPTDILRLRPPPSDRILRADALLVSAGRDFQRDGRGRPILKLAREGQGEPEEKDVVRYIDPRPAQWPPAQFIIGNPPFMGGKDMRRELGDGYVDALWTVRQGRFRSADLVTLWWDRAAEILTMRNSPLRRFGFITTNSITQTFSRRVLEHHLNGEPPMRLTFAIPDHPWIKGADRAEVRIAMTVAERGAPEGQGRLLTVTGERVGPDGEPEIEFREARGDIGADLSIGGGLGDACPLKANSLLCSQGVKLHGAGFIVSADQAKALSADSIEPPPIRDYRNGRDLAARPRGAKVIDLFGWSEEEARRRWPAVVRHLSETVKPERTLNARGSYRDNWWVFGEPRGAFREALEGLPRYIVTVEKSKHRWFRFLEADVLPDNTVVAIASDDPRVLGVLSSRVHGLWALACGGRLEDRPVYNKKACFDAFPFPCLDGPLGAEIGGIAEEMEALRRRMLSDDESLTMTALYNEREIAAKRGATSSGIQVLNHLHQRLDRAVLQGYGWPEGIEDEATVQALLRLNLERAEAEAGGAVRFLRPAYQRGRVRLTWAPVQIEAPLMRVAERRPLPDALDELAGALLEHLRREGAPLQSLDLARRFDGQIGRRETDRVEQMLAVLAVAGSVQRVDDGWFSPRGH